MFPKIEIEWWLCASTEHRADRQKLEARIAELEKQLADYAKKSAEK